MSSDPDHSNAYQGGYYGWHRGEIERGHRSIYHWKQPGIADAYNSNVPTIHQRDAQRRLHALYLKVQRRIARQLGQLDRNFSPRIPIQLGFFYTTSPRQMCARACLGQSALLEYRERQSDALVLTLAEPFFRAPAQYDNRYSRLHEQVDPHSLDRHLRAIGRVVEVRIVMEALQRLPRIGQLVEWARIYGADQLSLELPTVLDLVSAVTLYGDLIPEWSLFELHPITLQLLRDLSTASSDHLRRLREATPEQLAHIGLEWICDLGYAICSCLPPPPAAQESQPRVARAPSIGARVEPSEPPPGPAAPFTGETLPPLNAPAPPRLLGDDQGSSPLAEALEATLPHRGDGLQREPSPLESVVERVAKAMAGATKPASKWEDPGFDAIERKIRTTPFERSAIEGSPQEGREVRMSIDGKEVSGDIHEEVVAPTASAARRERLRSEAAPITDALRPLLFPSVDDRPIVETGLISGRIDGLRLHRAAYSRALFKRSRMMSMADQGGSPVLLIVLDASGSIGEEEMRLTKVIAAAFLGATRRLAVRVMCALYNQDRPHGKLETTAIIRWLYHPKRSLARTTDGALECLESVPDMGHGGQQDALSLQHCLQEARCLAGNQSIFLIHISDLGFCRSFSETSDAVEEVKAFYGGARKQLKNKFHSTLIALSSNDGAPGLTEVVDRILPVSRHELGDYPRIAEKIATYVAGCMRERRRVLETTRAI